MRIEEIKTLNTQERIPEFFYVFTNRYSDRLANRIENYNISLRAGSLVSSGMTCLYSGQIREAFEKGDLEYVPFVPNSKQVSKSFSPFLHRLVNRYSLEYNLELYRKYRCKTYPSRFSCLYAFGSREDCEKMANKRGWALEGLKKYRLKDLGDLNRYIKIVKTNFKMIGLLENYPFDFLEPVNQNILYQHYWSGGAELIIPPADFGTIGSDMPELSIPERRCGVIYEYLIEGILEEVKD